jgi:hypothetical protein
VGLVTLKLFLCHFNLPLKDSIEHLSLCRRTVKRGTAKTPSQTGGGPQQGFTQAAILYILAPESITDTGSGSEIAYLFALFCRDLLPTGDFSLTGDQYSV